MNDEKKRARVIDAAVEGAPADEESRRLAQTAEHVRRELSIDVPPAERQRALFVSGVAANPRKTFAPTRVLVPAFGIALIVFAAFAGQNALPGQGLYPMREALNSVGIGRSPAAEVDDHLTRAEALLDDAERSLERNPGRSLRLAVAALEEIGPARDLLPELNGQRDEMEDRVDDLVDDVVDIIDDARRGIRRGERRRVLGLGRLRLRRSGWRRQLGTRVRRLRGVGRR